MMFHEAIENHLVGRGVFQNQRRFLKLEATISASSIRG